MLYGPHGGIETTGGIFTKLILYNMVIPTNLEEPNVSSLSISNLYDLFYTNSFSAATDNQHTALIPRGATQIKVIFASLPCRLSVYLFCISR